MAKRQIFFTLLTSIQRAWRINLFALSAQLAYYEFISIFPLIIVCLSLLGFLPIDNIFLKGADFLSTFMPPSVIDFILNWTDGVRKTGGVTTLLLGAGALIFSGWATAGAFMHAFRIVEREPIRKKFMTVILVKTFFSLVVASLISLVFVIWVAGPALLSLVSLFFRMEEIWNWVWLIIRLPIGILIMTLCVALLYKVLGYRNIIFKEKLYGAFLAAIFCYLISWSFSLYLRAIPDLNITYGGIAGIVIFLIWLQMMNLSLLLGEVWNVELSNNKNY